MTINQAMLLKDGDRVKIKFGTGDVYTFRRIIHIAYWCTPLIETYEASYYHNPHHVEKIDNDE